MKENNLKKCLRWQDSWQILTYAAEISENEVEVIDYKTKMKTKMEIQMITQEIIIIGNGRLLDLQKRVVKATKKFLDEGKKIWVEVKS